MNFSLTTEQASFKDHFQRFCDARIMPHAKQADLTGCIPAESWRALQEVGYFQLFHPRELGGLEADGITLAIAMETLARACGSTFWTATISTALAGKVLFELGTPVHHQRWLRPILRGEKIGCFSVVERSAGCETNKCQARLLRSGQHFRLYGEKYRTSNATIAHVAVVYANISDTEALPGTPSAGYAVVDLTKPGIHRRAHQTLGLRGMPLGILSFDGVEIDADDVIRCSDVDKMMRAVEWGQYFQAACSIGFAEAALLFCIDHAKRRQAFGVTLADLQAVQNRIADMRVQIDAARLLCFRAGLTKAQGSPARELIMMSKIYATEMATRVTEWAMAIHGALGYTTDHVLERLHRDSLGNIPAGLPTDRLREMLACGMVGQDAWSYEPCNWLFASGMLTDGGAVPE